MELVGRLAAGVSHDLNNLLAVISSNLDMIEHVARSGKRRTVRGCGTARH